MEHQQQQLENQRLEYERRQENDRLEYERQQYEQEQMWYQQQQQQQRHYPHSEYGADASYGTGYDRYEENGRDYSAGSYPQQFREPSQYYGEEQQYDQDWDPHAGSYGYEQDASYPTQNAYRAKEHGYEDVESSHSRQSYQRQDEVNATQWQRYSISALQRRSTRLSDDRPSENRGEWYHDAPRSSTSLSGRLAYENDSDQRSAFSRSGSTSKSASRSSRSAAAAVGQGNALGVPVHAAARETVYEDDYEEDDSDPRSNRYTRYSVMDDGRSDENDGSNRQRDARTSWSRTDSRERALSIVPSAKCADCGQEIALDDLPDHSCLPRGESSLSLAQRIPSPLATSIDAASSPSPSTSARSPFFERYQHIAEPSARTSPAFTPTKPSRGASDLDRTPTNSMFRPGVRSQGPVSLLGGRDTPRARQDDSKPKPSEMEASLSSSSLGSLGGLDAENDEQARIILERKRHIERQREAKKKGGAAVAAAAVIATLRLQTSGFEQSKKRNSSHDKQPSSSSISSFQSSLLDTMSPRPKNDGSATPNSAALTPSSSYDRFSDAPHSPDHKDQAASTLSPTVKEREVAPMVRKKEGVDLGSIEDMMKRLTTSPKKSSDRYGDKGRLADGHDEDEMSARKPSKNKFKAAGQAAAAFTPSSRARAASRRCCICDCSLNSSRTPFVEQDGKLLCAADYADLYCEYPLWLQEDGWESFAPNSMMLT